MTGSMMDKTCAEFAEALAAKVSVPGGGGAAAYVGALAVALCSMTGNFTTGKKKYAAYEADIQRMLQEGEEVRERLLELVDRDAAAFLPLSEAYAIPKEDPGRTEALEAATKAALSAPLAMMQEIARAIELLEEMQEKGSRLLLSDVGCGAALAAAAMQAAALNVFVNTQSLTDRTFAETVEAEADDLLAYVSRAQAVVVSVAQTIRPDR